MSNAGQQIVPGGIRRPDGAGLVGGVLATKTPLPPELETAMLRCGINDIRISAKMTRGS